MSKGFAGTAILIFAALAISLIISFIFVARPYKVFGERVTPPFKSGGYVLSEKVTYLFQKPAVGDRVIFTPQETSNDFVGIITKTENQNNVAVYTIASIGNGRAWTVSADKISGKIYFPFLDQAEGEKIALSLLPTPTPTSFPELPSSLDVTN